MRRAGFADSPGSDIPWLVSRAGRFIPLSLAVMTLAIFASGCRTRPASTSASPARAGISAHAPHEHPDARLAEAKRLFFAAVDGDPSSLDRAANVLEALRAGGDARPQVTAYAGAVRLLSAPRARLPWEMGRRTREGIELMDRAVAEAPDDLEVRALRGLSYYRMPGFIGRGGMAADDLAAVAAGAEGAVSAGKLDPALAAAVLYHDGLIRERRGDPRSIDQSFRRAAQLAPDTPAGRAAAERLAK
jgi:hypothetical protein